MVCTIISGVKGIADMLVYPTSCDYFFYAKILFGLFIILNLILYFKEQERFTKPDMLSCLGTSSIVIVFLAMIGTFIKNSLNIPMIQQDIFLYIIAFAVVFIGIWFFKR